MQDKRKVEAPALGEPWNAVPAFMSVRAVLLHEAEAPVVLGVAFGVPLPMIEIPIPAGTVSPFIHVQEPAGMLMMSPSSATCVGPLTTALTSDWLQEAAV